MSLHKVPLGLLAFLLAAPLALAGCTLTPVYGDPATQAALTLNYPEPETRLEQVVYQALAARLPDSDAQTVPQLMASVSIAASRVGLSDVSSPVSDYQILATVSYTVTQDDAVLATGRRSASSGYQTNGQRIADDEARKAAEEQAARAAAEQVRLALIAQLAGR